MSYKHQSENLGGGKNQPSVFLTVFVVIFLLVIQLQLRKVIFLGEQVHKPTCRVKTNEMNSKRFGTCWSGTSYWRCDGVKVGTNQSSIHLLELKCLTWLVTFNIKCHTLSEFIGMHGWVRNFVLCCVTLYNQHGRTELSHLTENTSLHCFRDFFLFTRTYKKNNSCHNSQLHTK